MKYKYYFRKPSSEIVKDIVVWLAAAGIVAVAGGSPYLFINLQGHSHRWRKYKKRNVADTFSRLKKQGHIEIQKRNRQVYIHLTPKGKALAGWLQIDALEITRPKRWDGIYIFLSLTFNSFAKLNRRRFAESLRNSDFTHYRKACGCVHFHARMKLNYSKNFLASPIRKYAILQPLTLEMTKKSAVSLTFRMFSMIRVC